VSETVGFGARRLMELEVESLTGAAHGERSPDRGAPSRSQMTPACAGAGLYGAFDCQVAFSVNQSRP
jgi:hypothetical protein